MTERPLRVLHCPTAVGGSPPGLAKAERELGLDSVSVALFPQSLSAPADEHLVSSPNHRVALELGRWRLLLRALREFDVVHFNFGQTILPPYPLRSRTETYGLPAWVRHLYLPYARLVSLRDLAILRRAGKGIVVTFQGDDARQGRYQLDHYDVSLAHEAEPGYYDDESDAAKQRSIARFDRYADSIFYLNPDLAHVLPPRARFLPYGHLDLADWKPARSYGRPPLVVHAPTAREAKGTRFVLSALDQLRAEGVEFELQLVEGLSHADARDLYARADLFVDQLVAGWYGGVSVELMALGKPVVAFLRDEDLGVVPEAMRRELPVIRATTTTIAETLREWLTTRRDELPQLGERSRAFVERWHDPRRTAAMLKAEYERIVSARRR